jgi:CBS domain-containing protein
LLISEVMRRAVSSVGPGASLALASRQMSDQDVGCLPVIENGRLIGMITDRDIVVRGVAEGLDPDRSMVREAMSAKACACSVDDDLETARDLMVANLIKHLPVLDRRRRVAGLVSLRDITGQHGRCRPHQVTFYKRIVTSAGHASNVKVGKAYLSPAVRKEDAIATALAKFERDRGLASWDQAADTYAAEVPGEAEAPGWRGRQRRDRFRTAVGERR